MSGVDRICLLGFGEVGQILAADLAGKAQLSAYDILFPCADSAPARAQSRFNIRAAADAPSAAREADLIISAVTAAQDEVAARSILPALKRGAYFLDLNSCSPSQKQASAELIDDAGGRYVEAAVMTPFPPKRLASPILLGGPHAKDFAPLANALGFSDARFFSAETGQASATKMCRSVIIKGIEALLAESLLTARHHGVEADVLASLSDLLPVGDWPALARYMISRSLEHGQRRAEEMREVARTVADAGIAPLMSAAAVERQHWAAGHKDALAHADLIAMLDAILAAEHKS